MKTVLITAGGTVEPIDGVRGITNFSSGRLGALIADTLTESKVFLIKARKSAMPKNVSGDITIIETTDTQSVQDAIDEVMNNNVVDYFIHSMAISDYTVDKVVSVDELIEQIRNLDGAHCMMQDMIIELLQNPPTITDKNKISSTIKQPLIYLKQTPKIIRTIKQKWPDVKLIAFKLLNNVSESELISVAREACAKSNADYIVANDLKNISNDRHLSFFLDASNKNQILESDTKEELARLFKALIER